MIIQTPLLRNPKAIGRTIRQVTGSRYDLDLISLPRLADEWLSPVEMFSVTLHVAFAGTEALAGLKLHTAFAGSELHE
jgi:hypothetical protein